MTASARGHDVLAGGEVGPRVDPGVGEGLGAERPGVADDRPVVLDRLGRRLAGHEAVEADPLGRRRRRRAADVDVDGGAVDERARVAAHGGTARRLRDVIGVPGPAGGPVVHELGQVVAVGTLGVDVDRRGAVQDGTGIAADGRPPGDRGEIGGRPGLPAVDEVDQVTARGADGDVDGTPDHDGARPAGDLRTVGHLR